MYLFANASCGAMAISKAQVSAIRRDVVDLIAEWCVFSGEVISSLRCLKDTGREKLKWRGR